MKKSFIVKIALLLSLVLSILSGCTFLTDLFGGGDPVLVSISVTPETAALVVGGTQALTVTGSYDDGTSAALTADIAWSSSDSAVATAAGGTITALGAGSATVTATVSNLSDTVAVTVTALAVTGISAANLGVEFGGTATLVVTATYEDNSTASVPSGFTCSSATTSVATVTDAGVVTGVEVGTSVITVNYAGKSTTATATVALTPIVVYDEALGSGVSVGGYWNAGQPNYSSAPSTELARTGTSSMKFDWSTCTSWNGNALPISPAADLSRYNVLTFWARTSDSVGTTLVDKFGFGNGSKFEAVLSNVNLTTTWTEFVLPLPDPSLLTSVGSVFFTAGQAGVVAYVDDIQYERVDPATLTVTTLDLPAGPIMVDNGGSAEAEATGGGSITITIGSTPILVNCAFVTGYIRNWSSDATGIATVTSTGTISGISNGTANLTGTIGATSDTIPVTVSSPLNVTGDQLGVVSETYGGIVVGTHGTLGTWSDNGAVSTSITTADASEGTESWGIIFPGSQAGGGAFIMMGTARNLSHYSGGNLVFSMKATASVTSLEVKLEWTGGNALVNISAYTPVTSGGWSTYTIPLSAFTGIDLTKWTHLGFWHPNTYGSYYTGTIYIDNAYFSIP